MASARAEHKAYAVTPAPKKVSLQWLQTDAPGFNMVPFSAVSRDPMPSLIPVDAQGSNDSLIMAAPVGCLPKGSGRRGHQKARRRGRSKARQPTADEPAKISQIEAPNTEADWIRRFQHKIEAVNAIHRSEDYRKARASGKPLPESPDPSGRESKRTWEKSVQTWRNSLKKLHGE